MPSNNPGNPKSSPPANTANITTTGETPTLSDMIFGTNTLSETRATTNTIACTQRIVCNPSGAASTSATTCAASMPTNGTAYAIPATIASKSANLNPTSALKTKMSAPVIAQSATCPETYFPKTCASSSPSARAVRRLRSGRN